VAFISPNLESKLGATSSLSYSVETVADKAQTCRRAFSW